jgi:hypothetical protein
MIVTAHADNELAHSESITRPYVFLPNVDER